MALRIRRRKPRPARAHRLIRAGDRTMTFVGDPDAADPSVDPSIEEVDAALATVPEHIGWDWAVDRLIPVFERGYAEGVAGDPMVNTATAVGVGIGFGIDLGPVIARVTKSMAERWEASVEQIERAAFAHLAEVVADIGPGHVQPMVIQGHFFRALTHPPGWASSVLLAGETELIRIFGTRDAFFTAPARHSVLAFGLGTPTGVVAAITVECELLEPHPLQLDPFLLEDGVLTWDGAAQEDLIDAD